MPIVAGGAVDVGQTPPGTSGTGSVPPAIGGTGEDEKPEVGI